MRRTTLLEAGGYILCVGATTLLSSCTGAIVESDQLCATCVAEPRDQNSLPTDEYVYALPIGKVPIAVEFTAGRDGTPTQPKVASKISISINKMKLTRDPHPAYTFRLKYRHIQTSDDFVSVETDPQTNLLKRVATVSKDRTSDILVGINTALDKVVTLTTDADTPRRAVVANTKVCPGVVANFRVETDVDITDTSDIRRFKTNVNAAAREAAGQSAPLVCSYFSMESDGDEEKIVTTAVRDDVARRCSQGACFRLTRPVVADMIFVNEEHTPPKKPEMFKKHAFSDFLSFPAGDPYLHLAQQVQQNTERSDQPASGTDQSIISKVTLENKIAVSARFYVPVREAIGVINFNRHAFVENKVTAEFDGGMLKKLEATDPSEIQGFLSIPTQILQTAIIGRKL